MNSGGGPLGKVSLSLGVKSCGIAVRSTSMYLVIFFALIGCAFPCNLLLNPGGESGVADWEVITGSLGVYTYPDIADVEPVNPTPPDAGTYLFYGGNVPYTQVRQNISVGGATEYSLSAYVGGYFDQDDHMSVTLQFLDINGNAVGSNVTLGPLLAADRGGHTGFYYLSANGTLPTGTAQLSVILTFVRVVGTSNDGYVDNLSLCLTTPYSGETQTCNTHPGLSLTCYSPDPYLIQSIAINTHLNTRATYGAIRPSSYQSSAYLPTDLLTGKVFLNGLVYYDFRYIIEADINGVVGAYSFSNPMTYSTSGAAPVAGTEDGSNAYFKVGNVTVTCRLDLGVTLVWQ